MASGRPILAYGPRNIASLNYIDKNKVGMVVYDEESGKDTLTQLIRSKELRLSLGHKGFNISRIEFNQEKTNEILKNVVLKNLEDNL